MPEAAAGPTGPGTVVLALGADIGALILYTPAEMDRVEIEISRDDEPGGHSHSDAHSHTDSHSHRTHSQVRERPMGTVTEYAAVYPGLHAGQYTIWRDKHTPADTITITGGKVTTCRWAQ